MVIHTDRRQLSMRIEVRGTSTHDHPTNLQDRDQTAEGEISGRQGSEKLHPALPSSMIVR